MPHRRHCSRAERGRAQTYTFNSRFYRVTTDLRDRQLANDIARHMDAVYAEFAARMANFRANPTAAVRADERMPLYLMTRQEDYLDLLAGFGFNAANSGGVFFRGAKGSGLATFVEGQSRLRMEHVLQHEGFHQFADARIASGLPPWVNEGLAEYFGDAVMVKGKLQPGKLDGARLERMRRAVADKQVIPFRQLMNLDGRAWMARITAGDEGASLMYDTAWSVCYSLVHGGKQYRAALEQYLGLLNRGTAAPQAFDKVFGQNVDTFQKAWEQGLERMEPDPWFTAVRHLQLMAIALKAYHARGAAPKSFEDLKERLERANFRAEVRERDAVARADEKMGEDEEKKPASSARTFDFPPPATVELVPSEDPKFPPGLVVSGLKPSTLKLSWRLNAAGGVEEVIDYQGK